MRFQKCSVDGCERNGHRDGEGKLGMCSMHYQRAKRHGNPSVVKAVPSPATDWLRAHANHDGDECLTWPFAIGADGYGRVHEPKTGKLTTASRLMCVFAHGQPPTPKHEAAHSCGRGNQGCTNPNHIYWATSERNHADKIIHETTNRGERQWNSKLTEADVLAIRALTGTMSQAAIAKRFGVSRTTISDIQKGRRWAWFVSP